MNSSRVSSPLRFQGCYTLAVEGRCEVGRASTPAYFFYFFYFFYVCGYPVPPGAMWYWVSCRDPVSHDLQLYFFYFFCFSRFFVILLGFLQLDVSWMT